MLLSLIITIIITTTAMTRTTITTTTTTIIVFVVLVTGHLSLTAVFHREKCAVQQGYRDEINEHFRRYDRAWI